MKDYSISVQIAAPTEVVWGVISDIERWPEWTPSIRAIERTNAGPFRIGARARVHQPRLPAADWVVTSLQEGRGFEWESRAPGVHVLARHQAEPGGEGTRVMLSIQYRGIIGDLIGRLTAGINRRYLALEADGLKRRSEARAAGHD